MLSYIQICLKILVFLLSMTVFCNAIVLRAYISQHGLHGEIEFSEKNASIVSIRTNLKPTLEFPDQIWSWSIYQFPVDYTDISDSRCSEKNLGKEIINLTDELGYIVIPGKDQAEFESNNVLTGLNGFWGKSLLLKTAEHDRVICSSIVSNDHTIEKIAVAKFRSPIAGSIYFRWITLKELDQSDTYIETDLYHVQATTEKQGFTRHSWKVYVTDIFDSSRENFEDNCDVLQLVFDPDNKGNGEGTGDLDTRLGKVKIAVDASKDRARNLLRDENLSIMPSDIDGSRRNLYVVIFDSKHPDSFLACGKIRSVQPKMAKSLINMDGIRGEVEYTQQSPFEPTWIRFQLAASDGDYESSLRYVSSVQDYRIHQLPPKFEHKARMAYSCNTTGDVYNPKNLDLKTVPPPGLGTQDQYPIGDLLGKYKYKTEYLHHKYLLPGISNELSGLYWDVYLPLKGVNSVIHRSLVIHRSEQKAPICGILQQYDYDTEYETAVTIAQVIFRYPLVGKILLKQSQGKPWEDTTILMEYLIHADGSNINNTHEHRWAIHDLPPGRDYYNWTARCVSAGALYDPHKVAIDMRHPEESCQFDLEGLCRLGDLSTRHSTLTIAGRKRDADVLSRRLYTDTVLPLDGRHSIVKRSLVIYDDHGPVARGERMACSPIERTYRRKAVVKDWFGNGAPVSVTGRLEIIQQSEYQVANAEVDLQRLVDVKGYHIHVAPVEAELEFPCENSSLYDTFNPYHIAKNNHPPPTKGTPDQYELGDLSGKYGLINRKQKYEQIFNETQLSLFGPHSILGRSVVLHSSKGDGRWACSNIERGYSPSEARELRAIASFHNPAGFAYGYIRMTQLIYNDGSQSDTVIQVKLRHPGVRDRNMTYNHNWAIFVNPVSVDATVATQDTRCVAGGYRWNPYFTQLADPLNEDLYRQECGADNPLRCHVGDLSARLGPIHIGVNRQIFMDSNFPLEGTVSAQGRSIVIMGPEFDSRRYACANIEPDKDIIKYANIRKPPRFVITQFIEDVRGVMGIPEWMLSVDSRKTRTLHQETCIQFFLHFKGPQADRLEQDFARLLSTGRLDQPSIFIAGYIDLKRKKTLSYRQCGVRDPNEKKKPTSIFSTFTIGAGRANIHNYLIVTIPFLLLFTHYFL